MKKVPALCFALAAFLYASAANSRICFLGDTACQAGQFQAVGETPCAEQNSNLVYEYDRCERLVYGSPICNDSTGNYYEKGTCPAGYTDMKALEDKYVCIGETFGKDCGVECCEGTSPTDDKGDIMCGDQYQLCINNSEGSGEICTDKEGTKYTECTCSDSYSIKSSECEKTGLQGNYSDSCTDSDGNIWLKSCSCASGWSQTESLSCDTKCNYGGTPIEDIELPGSKLYCWKGCRCTEPPKCEISYQSDFDNYWAGYSVNSANGCNNLTVDCATLGYDTGTAGTGVTCKDGTEPYRCPFDHTKVYCESGINGSCEFITKADCEKTYFGSNCTVDSSKCYKPTSCKTGYGKTTAQCSNGEAGNWTLGQTDEYGCAVCQCESTCVNKISTIPGNATAVYENCTACNQTTQIISDFKCNEGYTKSQDGNSCVKITCSDNYARSAADCGTTGTLGWTLGTVTDDAGCYQCKMKTCPSGSSVGCTVHSYKTGMTNYYRGDTQCITCTTCPNNGYPIDSYSQCASGQIQIKSSDPNCFECKTAYDREQYGCNIEHAITVDADGNPTSDRYFDHCSCYWDDGYCNTAWVEEHGLCKKGDTHCFYCPGPTCSGGW